MDCQSIWAKDGLPRPDVRTILHNETCHSQHTQLKQSFFIWSHEGWVWCSTEPNPPFFLFLSDFKVAAVSCCCSPFGGYDHSTPTIYHVYKSVDRRSKMIEGKSVRIHASHFWARNIWTAAISLFWWIQSSSLRLKEFRTLRTPGMKLFTNSFMHFIVSFAISITRFPGVQEATSTSSWSPHCMEMAWFMHIRL